MRRRQAEVRYFRVSEVTPSLPSAIGPHGLTKDAYREVGLVSVV